jgi:hypothetical protein
MLDCSLWYGAIELLVARRVRLDQTADGESMTTVQPLETNYAGHRFRSRLEARWAVAFDHLGIEWQYEAQGYTCSRRLGNDDSTFAYLPDFWLPKLRIFAEVKGQLTESELVHLLNIAASLSSNNGGGCHDSGGHEVAILGPVPEPSRGGGPWVLHMHKGDLLMAEWTNNMSGGCMGDIAIASDYGGANWAGIRNDDNVSVADAIRLLLGGAPGPSTYWAPAYRAARSARFEHLKDLAKLNLQLLQILECHDLGTLDGRVGALWDARPLIAAVTDPQQRHSVARQFAIDSRTIGSLKSSTHWAEPSTSDSP